MQKSLLFFKWYCEQTRKIKRNYCTLKLLLLLLLLLFLYLHQQTDAEVAQYCDHERCHDAGQNAALLEGVRQRQNAYNDASNGTENSEQNEYDRSSERLALRTGAEVRRDEVEKR